jgi:hypothetical protein
LGSNPVRELDRGVAEAATDIENPIAFPGSDGKIASL